MTGERTPPLLAPLYAARRALGVGPEDDASAIKRAYRRAVLENPPDGAPEKFQEIREAYELLSDPIARGRARLTHPLPWSPPPAVPRAETTTDLAVALIRKAVGRLSAAEAACLTVPPAPRASGRRKKDKEPAT